MKHHMKALGYIVECSRNRSYMGMVYSLHALGRLKAFKFGKTNLVQ